MKRIFTLCFAFLIYINCSAEKLILLQTERGLSTGHFITDPVYRVNYIHTDFLIASVQDDYSGKGIVLDENAWQTGYHYLMSYTGSRLTEYKEKMEAFATILFTGQDYLVLKVSDVTLTKVYPVTHSGLDAIHPYAISITEQHSFFNPSLITNNPIIAGYVDEVSEFELMPKMQHLQNYGTRNCYTPQAIEAQDWIKQTFESYGLPTVLHDFNIGSQNPSDNVIATQPGILYPDEYIIVGGHYDSYVFSGGSAPGADDNASGTSGVIEVARVLSQYDFERTIIYCAFSGEEYGLYGSAAWVAWAKANNMNILGYVNMDMIGYVAPGIGLHTHIIAPASAQPLIDFYTAVANTYVPDMGVYMGTLSGGNSDHSSFNSQGYMGIFPFEDSQNYSPYIHSVNDIMGLSVNSTDLAMSLTKAALATLATVAQPFNGFYPPMNLTYQQTGNVVNLSWSEPLNVVDFEEYNVYRNNELLATLTGLTATSFDDTGLTIGGYYEYYVTAVYGGTQPGESNPSNIIGVSFGLVTVYEWDFESGVQGWTILNTNTGWKWGLSVPLTGNNTQYLGINSDAYGQSANVKDYAISPVLDLTDYFDLKLVFDYGFRKYTSDYIKVMYRTNAGELWIELSNLPSSTSFTNSVVILPPEAITASTQVAFYYNDNNTWAWYAGVDNVKITGYDPNLTGINNPDGQLKTLEQNFPNPFSSTSTICYALSSTGKVRLAIYDLSGREVALLVNDVKTAGSYNVHVEAKNLQNGIYYYILEADNQRTARKMVVIR